MASTMKMAFAKLQPSPASTYLPSPGLSSLNGLSPRSSRCTSEDVETTYQALAESEQKTSSWIVGFTRCRCLILSASFFLVVIVTALSLALRVPSEPSASSPRIWDPHLLREYSYEPLAKTIIRQFDAYNMARGGLDDAATFNANVQRYMAPDLVYESVGFGNWTTPAGWARGEEHNYGTAFPETIFTQMLFFGDKSVSTTTTYGRALWSGDMLGVPASHTWVNLRITDFYHIRKEKNDWGRIDYNFMMIDWADLMRQVGRPVLATAPLQEGLVLPPAANDGVPAPLSFLVQSEGRNATAANTAAIAALNEWVGQDAKAHSWHKDLTFYGPGGIGLAQSSQAYQDHVLRPFHAAFSNRSVNTRLSACEGNYCAAFGEFHARGIASWLGLPTKGKQVAIRFGMHWRITEGKIKEGWAIFDIPGLFAQLGLNFWETATRGEA